MRMYNMKKPTKWTAPSSGFTLMELLTVVAIIAILAALLLRTVGFIQTKSASARAEAEIAALSAALESYKADNGDYPINNVVNNPAQQPPVNTVLLTALMPSSGKVYFEFPKGMTNAYSGSTNIMDPFGERYGYCYPGVYNGSNAFDLWSRAGTTNTNVWIKNW